MPLAIALHEQLGAHLGASMAAQAAADGVNYDWWNEFLAQTSGVGAELRAGDPRLRGGDQEPQHRRGH